MDATLAHDSLLGLGTLLLAAHDRTGMAHGAALRRGHTRDEADHRLGAVLGDPTGGLDLQVTADLADHDDALGLVVGHEQLNGLERRGADDGVTADADGRALTEAGLGDLVHGLIRQRAALGNDADAAGVEDEAGHDAHLGLARRHDARAVRADQRAAGQRIEVGLDLDHVGHGDALGNADDDLDAGIGRLEDGVGGEGRRNEEDAGVGPRLLHRVLHRVEDRLVEVGLTAFARGHAAHDVGAVLDHLAGVEGAFGAGEALDDDAGIFVDENAHGDGGSGFVVSLRTEVRRKSNAAQGTFGKGFGLICPHARTPSRRHDHLRPVHPSRTRGCGRGPGQRPRCLDRGGRPV